MQQFIKKIGYITVGIVIFLLPKLVFADTCTTESCTIISPILANNFTELLALLAKGLVRLAVPILVIIIVWSGVQLIISSGSPDKISKAWNTLKYALIGFGVILIGEGFVTLVKSILNLGN